MVTNISGKKVLIRVDFNVPLNSQQEITDDTRMIKALPTINKVLDEGAAVILMSHLGRPLKKLNDNGTINKQKYSLRPCLLYTSPSPRDRTRSRMPSSA